ncbi:hypothetical protein [Citrobacter sp. JGM124]|uniref:hypothetical protein n=1 Tax=Citrobacter sp. JGM124 TaxID=2799789 RepID=UPI001BA66712|nr:hypothetical protein [Citrobacter sp. JGM124]MBS0847290.1 hypothetical protein [Citrobacter sp. JGM124]
MEFYGKFFFCTRRREAPDVNTSDTVISLDTVLAEGDSLYQEANDLTQCLRQRDDFRQPALSIKTKTGLLMGIALLLTGGGYGLYFKRASKTGEYSNQHNHKNSATEPGFRSLLQDVAHAGLGEGIHSASLKTAVKKEQRPVISSETSDISEGYNSLHKRESTPLNVPIPVGRNNLYPECDAEVISERCQRIRLKRPRDNNADDQQDIIIKKNNRFCYCPLPEHSQDEATTLISSQASTVEPGKTILTAASPMIDGITEQDGLMIQRCRNRLIGYINSHVNVPFNVDNKQLGKLALGLISEKSFHEAQIARIYLYGTGLFGERDYEIMSADVQHQLTSDLLAKLIYGESLDDYLLYKFSVNRYISIERYKTEVVNDRRFFLHDEASSELSDFYNKYLNPDMSFLNSSLNRYSDVLVGSITWFMIYLSSEFTGFDDIKNKEGLAIENGIKLLSYFVKGELYQGSEYKISLGLKFIALYLDSSLTPDRLPDFNGLWNIFITALTKRVELSNHIFTQIKEIVTCADDVNDKPWFSENEFANDILRRFCRTDNPKLYFIRPAHYESITKETFIESTQEQAWCDIKGPRGQLLRIKIPTIKYKFRRLRRDYFNMVTKNIQLFIENALTKNDFFNPKLDGDDFDFIDKSALEMVKIQLNEHRFPQELRIGPPLKKFVVKDNYLFFRASFHGEKRLYALDCTHKELLQKIDINNENILQKIGVFFKDWSFYPSSLLNLSVSVDRESNITVSEKEPTQVFINKILEQKNKEIDLFIKKINKELSSLDVDIYEVAKELFIPFYSCAKSLQGDDATDAFVSCLMDGIFLILPMGSKAVKTTQRVSERFIDLSFMVKKNKVFVKDGKILWKKIGSDLYIYNTILNEHSMLKSSMVDLFISSLDPGFGLLKELKNIIGAAALAIIKGSAINASLFSVKNASKLIAIGFRTKSIGDSAKKIFMKVSRPSGRLGTRHLPESQNTTDYSAVYGQVHQLGEYYLYHKNSDDVDMILGITDEVTDNEDTVYVVLDGDELNGVIFRCICRDSSKNTCDIIHWSPYEMFAERTLSANNKSMQHTSEAVFKPSKEEQFSHLIYYPGYQCMLSGDGMLASKMLTIIKISNVHYLYFPEEKQLRLLYDGDLVEVKSVMSDSPAFNIKKDSQGRMVITPETPSVNAYKSVFNSAYSYYGHFPVNSNGTEYYAQSLHYLSDRLFLNVHGRYFELGVTAIRNQFVISVHNGFLPSFIVSLDSLLNKFSVAKPFLKKDSPHIGMALERVLTDTCNDEIKQFPTLLVNGAISSRFNVKLRAKNSYYSLGNPVNQLYPLRCDSDSELKIYWLQYDLFTESFEFISISKSSVPPKNSVRLHYDELIEHFFSVERFPNMIDIINISNHKHNNKLVMRLLQAAFLKRLNHIDRQETLQLPLVQVFSWQLHKDTRSFQKKYPAAALWMTWQRQLQPLLRHKSLPYLPLIRKVRLQNDKYQPYINGFLIVGHHTTHEAVWVHYNEEEEPLILQAAEKNLNGTPPINENIDIYWLPKARHSTPITVTQFMYEKDMYPRVIHDKKLACIYITNSYFGDAYPYRYSADFDVEHIVISPKTKWMAIIDSKKNLLLYDLVNKDAVDKRTLNKNIIIHAKLLSKFERAVGDDYSLCIIDDDGIFYYVRSGLWVENYGSTVLWSPPLNYNPSFVSQDQRFLGYKHIDTNNIIIYDRKRKLMRAFYQPFSVYHKKNIISVAFSALNAVAVLAFDDGYIYLYDLVQDIKGEILDPIAYIKLNDNVEGKPFNNIVMRFDDVFETLTVIHAEQLLNPDGTASEVVYTRSSYSFTSME